MDPRNVGKQQFSGGISQLDERTDMTSLNKDSTFEREDLSEMLSAGQKTQTTIGGNSRRGANQMVQAANLNGSNKAASLRNAGASIVQNRDFE